MAPVQKSRVDFHMMKVRLPVKMVAPPKTTINNRLTHCIVSSFLNFHHKNAAWAIPATTATDVAQIIFLVRM